jgi:hypothetical protein
LQGFVINGFTNSFAECVHERVTDSKLQVSNRHSSLLFTRYFLLPAIQHFGDMQHAL